MWSILGARQGCYMTNCTDWDYSNVRDFEWLNTFWEEEVRGSIDSEHEIYNECERLGLEILKGTRVDIDVAPLSAGQSKFFKTVYQNTPRIIRSR